MFGNTKQRYEPFTTPINFLHALPFINVGLYLTIVFYISL
jgi:hypothetical protein